MSLLANILRRDMTTIASGKALSHGIYNYRRPFIRAPSHTEPPFMEPPDCVFSGIGKCPLKNKNGYCRVCMTNVFNVHTYYQNKRMNEYQ